MAWAELLHGVIIIVQKCSVDVSVCTRTMFPDFRGSCGSLLEEISCSSVFVSLFLGRIFVLAAKVFSCRLAERVTACFKTFLGVSLCGVR